MEAIDFNNLVIDVVSSNINTLYVSQAVLSDIRQLIKDQSNSTGIRVHNKQGTTICSIFSYETLDLAEELGKILKYRRAKSFKQTIEEEIKPKQHWEGSFKADFDF